MLLSHQIGHSACCLVLVDFVGCISGPGVRSLYQPKLLRVSFVQVYFLYRPSTSWGTSYNVSKNLLASNEKSFRLSNSNNTGLQAYQLKNLVHSQMFGKLLLNTGLPRPFFHCYGFAEEYTRSFGNY